MKVIKYKICKQVNNGTDGNPEWVEILHDVELGWNEVNEEIAKREAHNGEYTIEEAWV